MPGAYYYRGGQEINIRFVPVLDEETRKQNLDTALGGRGAWEVPVSREK